MYENYISTYVIINYSTELVHGEFYIFFYQCTHCIYEIATESQRASNFKIVL